MDRNGSEWIGMARNDSEWIGMDRNARIVFSPLAVAMSQES